MQQHLHKCNHLGKDEPNINHLDVGCLGEGARDTDEEGGEDKEGGQVDSHNCFKKEVFEEISCINNDQDKECRKVYCKNGIVDPSLQNYFDMDPSFNFI